MKSFTTFIFFIISLNHFNIYAGDPAKQKVVKQSDDIYISFRYRPGIDMHLQIGRCGINNLFNIKAIYIEKNLSKYVSPKISEHSQLLLKSCTDWIGPYMVKSNEDEDILSPSFTGGWHGSNGDATGVPTAWSDSINVTVNGEPIKEKVTYDSDVKICADNYIMGYNTITKHEPVMKEKITFDVREGVVNVEINSTALKTVTVYKYYGLQTQDFSNTGKVCYGNGKLFNLGMYSDCGKKGEQNIVNKFSVTNDKNECKISAMLNTNVGLGNFENITNEEPTIFTAPYGKTYFNLIAGKGKVMKKGDVIHWEGSYTFE